MVAPQEAVPAGPKPEGVSIRPNLSLAEIEVIYTVDLSNNRSGVNDQTATQQKPKFDLWIVEVTSSRTLIGSIEIPKNELIELRVPTKEHLLPKADIYGKTHRVKIQVRGDERGECYCLIPDEPKQPEERPRR